MGPSEESEGQPKHLEGTLPASISAIKQEVRTKLKDRWTQRWKAAGKTQRLLAVGYQSTSDKHMKQLAELPRRQGAMLTHLRSRHIALNAFLHRIQAIESPECEHCERGEEETIRHYLFECPAWNTARRQLVQAVGRQAESLSHLLNDKNALHSLMRYINSTGRFRKTYGNLYRKKYTE